jgi:hypothetical protein
MQSWQGLLLFFWPIAWHIKGAASETTERSTINHSKEYHQFTVQIRPWHGNVFWHLQQGKHLYVNGKHQQAAALSLDFSNLVTIYNGDPDDPMKDRPFDCHFSIAKILSSFAKIGFVPFTRNCLRNPKVGKELGLCTRDEGLEQLQLTYDLEIDVIETIGFNAGILDSVVPSAVHVDWASTAEEQVEQLLNNGKAFSASGHWNLCDSRIGNAGVTLIAQKRRLARNEEQRLKVVAKKTNASNIALQNAQHALAKYLANNNSLNDKDWSDVVRWALPEAKVEFLLKDFK